MKRDFRVVFCGGPWDGQELRLGTEWAAPSEIILREVDLHKEAREHVYRRQPPSGKKWRTIRYRLAEQSQLPRLYQIELSRGRWLLDYVEELKATITRLRKQTKQRR